MSSNKQPRFTGHWIAALILLGAACSSGGEWSGLGQDGPGRKPAQTGRTGDPCATPQAGCSCEDEGAVADCGEVSETYEDYVTCSMGERTCLDGEWGECLGDRRVQMDKPGPERFMIQSLGSGSVCPDGFDVCDPYCHLTEDTPGNSGAGGAFSDENDGLKLAPSAAT